MGWLDTMPHLFGFVVLGYPFLTDKGNDGKGANALGRRGFVAVPETGQHDFFRQGADGIAKFQVTAHSMQHFSVVLGFRALLGGNVEI